MKVEEGLFIAGFFAFLPVALVYGWLTEWDELVGPVALGLLAIMCGMIGVYLRLTAGKLDPRPEDDPAALQSAAEGDYGFFAPTSWWPLPLSIGAALLFTGLAVGWWLFIVGLVVGTLALIGWCFEFFRGDNAI